MLKQPTNLLDQNIFLPLMASGKFLLVIVAEFSQNLMSARSMTPGVAMSTAAVPDDSPVFPMTLRSTTKEVVRQEIFCETFVPVLESMGFVAHQEMNKFVNIDSTLCEYGNSSLDVAFYHEQNFCAGGGAVVGGAVMTTRYKPVTKEMIDAEGAGIELKRSYQSERKSFRQAQAECFLLASNLAYLALQKCSVLRKITTYIVVIIMDKDVAKVVRLELIFRDPPRSESAVFTVSTEGDIRGTISSVVHHLRSSSSD